MVPRSVPSHESGGRVAIPTGCRNNCLVATATVETAPATLGQQTQSGQRRYHHLAVLRAHVLRGACSRCTSPSGRWTRGRAGLARRAPEHPARLDQHDRPGAVQRDLPDGRVRGRTRPDQAHQVAAAPESWGLREWYVLTFLMGLYFVLGQGYEYLSLVRGEHLTIASSAYGSVFYLTTGFHGLHVTGGLMAFLFLLGRTYAARSASPMSSRSARSSCPTTGTSSTSSGSACSPSSTSSNSQGTASELDQRQAQAPGRRLRGTATWARRCRAGLRVAHLPGGAAQASAAVGARRTSRRARSCFRRTARAATASRPRAPSQAPSLIGAGAAAVDFQMSTGRMPAKEVGAEMPRKPVTFTQAADPRHRRLRRLAGRRARRSRTPSRCRRVRGEHGARLAAVQRELRAVPQLRRRRRRADLRQERAVAHRVHPDPDLRGHADRARGHAGVRRRRRSRPQASGTSSPTSRRPGWSPTRAASRSAAPARSPRAW